MWTQVPIQIFMVIFQSWRHEKWDWSLAEFWTVMYEKLSDVPKYFKVTSKC